MAYDCKSDVDHPLELDHVYSEDELGVDSCLEHVSDFNTDCDPEDGKSWQELLSAIVGFDTSFMPAGEAINLLAGVGFKCPQKVPKIATLMKEDILKMSQSEMLEILGTTNIKRVFEEFNKMFGKNVL